MSTTPTKTRRIKWHPAPPPPPSPKILNLPRCPRRKQPRRRPISSDYRRDYYRGKLESLFDQERAFSRTIPVVLLNSGERRERVNEEEEECGKSGYEFVEETWRFQAEILRAECNFLRMEREFALKKLERNRVQMERTLRSAVQTLVSGRKKIYEGKNVSAVLEEEIEDLGEKLEELQRSSEITDYRARKCRNFDRQASLLQLQLEKLGELSDEGTNTIPTTTNHEIDKESFISNCRSNNNKFSNNVQMEVLRMKMEGLSKGIMAESMEEEYGSMLSPTTTIANSSVAGSASTAKRTQVFLDPSTTRHRYQESIILEENKCSGRCKAVLRKIVEQVRAETEQWSQMQEMLGQVREEMEELQSSRNFWEERALHADTKIQSLRSTVEEWKGKAFKYETNANELQEELSVLRGELEKLRREKKMEDFPPISLTKQLQKEKEKEKEYFSTPTKDLAPISLAKQIEKEKCLLMHRLKENQYTDGRGKRSPFRDIGNSSPLLMRQKSKAVFPLHSPKPLRKEENL